MSNLILISKKEMKKVLIFGVMSLLAMSFSACSDDDPNYDNVTPPAVPVAANTLSGVVTDMQGNGINGATVNLGSRTAQTNNDGIYTFDNVTEGTYVLSAAANGKVTVTGTLNVRKNNAAQNFVWNATLATVKTTNVNVTVTGGGEGAVESEALKDNDPGKVNIALSVPQNVVPENTNITITPIYTESSAAVSKAASETMLIGATVACSDAGMQLDQDFQLTFQLDQSVVSSVVTKKYVNGRWVDAPKSVVNGNVVISAREFTSYGIFLPVTVSTKVVTESLVFTQAEWNNLYGGNTMNVGDATFSYKVGTQITSRATNKLEGLLIEHLSRLFGATVTTVQGTYPINITLPIGTALKISGAQERTDITVSAVSKNVTGSSYGTTNVSVITYNRQHNGGSSAPVGQ